MLGNSVRCQYVILRSNCPFLGLLLCFPWLYELNELKKLLLFFFTGADNSNKEKLKLRETKIKVCTFETVFPFFISG